MAVNLKRPDLLRPVPGIELATGSAGLRASGDDDLALITLPHGSQAAGVFTQSGFSAAPVHIARRHLELCAPRALLINAGNANAGTGQRGLEDALGLCAEAASLLDLDSESILPFSTGVIGQFLPTKAIRSALRPLPDKLSEEAWLEAAAAIMTTDTVVKGMSLDFQFQGQSRTVTGIAKGSGMICPNMATMLAFIATDAPVGVADLSMFLHAVVARTFNRITVDGDTSTNDACLLISTSDPGASLTPDTADWQILYDQFEQVALYLAQAIIRDAEGATKFISIQVDTGHNEDECLQVAYAIAHSPLVKTAAFGSNLNWGRLLMAIGRAGCHYFDPDTVVIYLGDLCVFRQGRVAEDYQEDEGARLMALDELKIRVSLGQGESQATIWTSDLSCEYVRINSEYLT